MIIPGGFGRQGKGKGKGPEGGWEKWDGHSERVKEGGEPKVNNKNFFKLNKKGLF